jgi:hypothetical protein
LRVYKAVKVSIGEQGGTIPRKIAVHHLDFIVLLNKVTNMTNLISQSRSFCIFLPYKRSKQRNDLI